MPDTEAIKSMFTEKLIFSSSIYNRQSFELSFLSRRLRLDIDCPDSCIGQEFATIFRTHAKQIVEETAARNERVGAAFRWTLEQLRERIIINFSVQRKLQKHKHGDRLSASRVHNFTSSYFHNLPMELIIEVASYLDPVGCFVLQRVCSRFRSGIARYRRAVGLEREINIPGQFYQLTFLLRQGAQLRLQENYYQQCDLAMQSVSHFGCSGCCTTHTMEHFSAQELDLSPKARICKGLAARFYICDHLSFSGHCLLRALRILKNAEFYCRMSHQLQQHWSGVERLGWGDVGPKIGFHRGNTITIDTSIPILFVEENESVTHDMLVDALHAKQVYICPHSNSRSPWLFAGKSMTADCPDCADPNSAESSRLRPCFWDLKYRRLRRGECVVWSQCPHPHCLTRYCLRREPVMTHCVYLEVSRDLLGSPTHPAWLAQAETTANSEIFTTPEHSVSAGTTTQSSGRCDRTRQEHGMIDSLSEVPEIGEAFYNCHPRYKKCELDCVLGRCGAFISTPL